jgi:uncharacterized protein YggE
MMKNRSVVEFVILVTAMIVVLVVFSGFQGVQARNDDRLMMQQQQPQPTAENRRTVTVSGNGRSAATPDQAQIVIGVETQAETASEALSENNTQMQALITSLTGADVERRDIQTQNISLYPRYSQPTNPEAQAEVIGYTASNTVQVTVRDLDALGSLLDTAIQAGGNTIQGISFQVSDTVEATDQARELAFTDAQRKAQQLAGLAELELGEVISINETGFSTPPMFARGGVAFDAAQSVPVEPGSQMIELSLQVTWELVGE